MPLLIKGEPVVLVEKRVVGKDIFNHPIYEEVETVIDDVLIAPTLSDDIVSETDLVSRKSCYTLGIPKTDTHDWANQLVKFWGKTYKVYGTPLMGIDANIPLKWNKKVTVELYE